jgi:hypothetical protein
MPLAQSTRRHGHCISGFAIEIRICSHFGFVSCNSRIHNACLRLALNCANLAALTLSSHLTGRLFSLIPENISVLLSQR